MADVSLKERFSALGNLPSFFKLVWKTSRSLTLATAMIRMVRSAITVSKHAKIKYPEVRNLADSIIASPEGEIAQMESIIKRIKK